MCGFGSSLDNCNDDDDDDVEAGAIDWIVNEHNISRDEEVIVLLEGICKVSHKDSAKHKYFFQIACRYRHVHEESFRIAFQLVSKVQRTFSFFQGKEFTLLLHHFGIGVHIDLT